MDAFIQILNFMSATKTVDGIELEWDCENHTYSIPPPNVSNHNSPTSTRISQQDWFVKWVDSHENNTSGITDPSKIKKEVESGYQDEVAIDILQHSNKIHNMNHYQEKRTYSFHNNSLHMVEGRGRAGEP